MPTEKKRRVQARCQGLGADIHTLPQILRQTTLYYLPPCENARASDTWQIY
jgi:hypothetical protein